MVSIKVVLAYFMSFFCTTFAEKRVLTYDPQYVHGLEAKFQALETKVLGLESHIVLLENKNQDLQTNINHTLETKVHGLESQSVLMKNKIQDLQIYINHTLETKVHGLESQIVSMENKNQALQIYINHTLETKVHGLETQIVSMENKNQDLQTNFNHTLETKTKELESNIVLLENKVKVINSLKGGVYTRWGRNSCPGNNTELVYSGYAGGSWYDQPGAAAEYVCLPRDPINHTYFTLNNDGRMYGAEYVGGSLQDQDVPCAVCRSTGYSSILMIPARNQCYPGWVEQYHGMLSSGYYAWKAATQYVCLDAEPEVVPHGHQDDNGKLFGSVTSQCGSLPCPPYTQGTVLSCVVCAK